MEIVAAARMSRRIVSNIVVVLSIKNKFSFSLSKTNVTKWDIVHQLLLQQIISQIFR